MATPSEGHADLDGVVRMEESFGYRRLTMPSSRPPGDGSSCSSTTTQPSIFRLFTSAELQLGNHPPGRAIHVTERNRRSEV